MRSILTTIILAAALVAFSVDSASASAKGLSATVNGPPEVQRVGNSYLVTINVRRTGGWIAKFCFDFGDDNNSWKVVMPGLRAYDGDAFCFGTLRSRKKQFVARIIAAKTGQKKLEVCLGHATIYKEANNVVLDDNQLCWSDSFVLVG